MSAGALPDGEEEDGERDSIEDAFDFDSNAMPASRGASLAPRATLLSGGLVDQNALSSLPHARHSSKHASSPKGSPKHGNTHRRTSHSKAASGGSSLMDSTHRRTSQSKTSGSHHGVSFAEKHGSTGRHKRPPQGPTHKAATTIQASWKRNLAQRNVSRMRVIYQDARNRHMARETYLERQKSGDETRRCSWRVVREEVKQDLMTAVRKCMLGSKLLLAMERNEVVEEERSLPRMLKVQRHVEELIAKDFDDKLQFLTLFGAQRDPDHPGCIKFDEERLRVCDLAARKIQEAWTKKQMRWKWRFCKDRKALGMQGTQASNRVVSGAGGSKHESGNDNMSDAEHRKMIRLEERLERLAKLSEIDRIRKDLAQKTEQRRQESVTKLRKVYKKIALTEHVILRRNVPMRIPLPTIACAYLGLSVGLVPPRGVSMDTTTPGWRLVVGDVAVLGSVHRWNHRTGADVKLRSGDEIVFVGDLADHSLESNLHGRRVMVDALFSARPPFVDLEIRFNGPNEAQELLRDMVPVTRLSPEEVKVGAPYGHSMPGFLESRAVCRPEEVTRPMLHLSCGTASRTSDFHSQFSDWRLPSSRSNTISEIRTRLEPVASLALHPAHPHSLLVASSVVPATMGLGASLCHSPGPAQERQLCLSADAGSENPSLEQHEPVQNPLPAWFSPELFGPTVRDSVLRLSASSAAAILSELGASEGWLRGDQGAEEYAIRPGVCVYRELLMASGRGGGGPRIWELLLKKTLGCINGGIANLDTSLLPLWRAALFCVGAAALRHERKRLAMVCCKWSIGHVTADWAMQTERVTQALGWCWQQLDAFRSSRSPDLQQTHCDVKPFAEPVLEPEVRRALRALSRGTKLQAVGLKHHKAPQACLSAQPRPSQQPRSARAAPPGGTDFVPYSFWLPTMGEAILRNERGEGLFGNLKAASCTKSAFQGAKQSRAGRFTPRQSAVPPKRLQIM